MVNPGSVGLPAYTDGEPVKHSMQMGAPHARYAVLERKKASDPWQVTFRVVAYDWEGAAARAAAKGREDWAHALRTGYAATAPLIPAKAGIQRLRLDPRLRGDERTTSRPSPPKSAPSRQTRAASRAAAASPSRGPRC